ncbi:hypothetical protein J0A67_17225 [Algoriphagus aestuariicola]|uniref:Uncharacterized protein n=1 Tax=Algoriphagus aestuariicola TaxID=1852016 RepID=A0ABS3BUQ6_9BACT|nr:hypothetical protein [Algoriphagus aestuariicola]MBN7802621.1 hypothetical protein [Algoriphagus aestuariicola]
MQTSLYDHQLLASDQPQTCPVCGLRTEILSDLSHTLAKTQIHRCPDKGCGFEFVATAEDGQVFLSLNGLIGDK